MYFGLTLHNSKLNDVTDWYQKQFGDVIDSFLSDKS
jgi:hypothetical protein